MEDSKIADLLTIKQVSESMHVSRQTVYAWINNGKLKPIQTPGGRLRIPAAQLIINRTLKTAEEDNKSYPIVDISNHEPLQPEWMGTKPKNWFARTEKHWYWDSDGDKFLFKSGREGTGENWAEKIACELCDLLELPHAEYDLAVFNGTKGVITPNFVPAGTRLVHGNEILANFVPKYQMEQRFKQRQHTLKVVYTVICNSEVEPPLKWSATDNIVSAIDIFLGYLMLDAWIANQDRHHENWGFISDQINRRIYLAPTFDHASSIGRNETDTSRESRLHTRDQGRSMENYVKKARSAFYETTTSTKPMLTIDVFGDIAAKRAAAARSWLRRLEDISATDVNRIIDKIPRADMSDIAREFTQKMLDLNRKRLLEMELDKEQ